MCGRIIVDEGQDLPGCLGNCSISSSCGITIDFDNVFDSVLCCARKRCGGHHDQFEWKRRHLHQHRGNRPLGIAAQTLDGHNHRDFHDMKLIVQIPAYNEETTIAQTLRDIPKKIEGISQIETLV